MTEPVWIEKPECLALRSMVLARLGGRDGIREEGLLESGLNRLHNLFAHGEPTHFDLAAFYASCVLYVLTQAFEARGFEMTVKAEKGPDAGALHENEGDTIREGNGLVGVFSHQDKSFLDVGGFRGQPLNAAR